MILGPKRLPDVGKSLGRGIREFKDSVSGHEVPKPLPTEAVTTDQVAVTAVPLTEVLTAEQRPVAAVAADRVVATTTETS